MFSEETMTPVRTRAQSLQQGKLDPELFALTQENPMILKPGRQLGPYRLLERLGQGGQGEVWKARRLGGDGELAALKILKPELAHNPARKAQFRREAQRGLRLKGRSLLVAFELAEIDGFHVMAMPFVPGLSMRDLIKGRISYLSGEEPDYVHPFVSMPDYEYYRAMAAALAEASFALSEAHEKQVVHRDIKPANLLLDNRRDGGIYLCDFGLGRDLDVATCEQMRDGAGTPIYMAPERLLCFAADEIKCDIYSMGVTLFEALLLEKPFRIPAEVTGPHVAPVLARAKPKPVRQLEPDFPRELEAVITKAMARNPVRRFASARDLALSLLEFVESNATPRRDEPHAWTSSWPARERHHFQRREPALGVDHSEAFLTRAWQ